MQTAGYDSARTIYIKKSFKCPIGFFEFLHWAWRPTKGWYNKYQQKSGVKENFENTSY